MEVICKAKDFGRFFKNPVLTLGNFDGVHLGHQRIFQQVRRKAQEIGGESIAYTFAPHPVQLLKPEKEPFLLLPISERIRLIGETGMDVTICAPFTQEFASLTAEEFVRDILHRQIGVRQIYVGQNTSFGRGRTGSVALLKELGERYGFAVEAMEAVEVKGTLISSSRIRRLIRGGNIPGATELLGRPPLLVGEVIRGFGRGGKKLGFPTANLKIEKVLVPKPGIYAVWAICGGQKFPGVANLGWNPTFQDGKFSIEVHILNFNKDIYGQTLRLEFVERQRDEVTFRSPEELITQIKKDVEQAKRILGVV
ncbi:MAG: bifunctional riboflavin kinase/FAD synthetase [Syntrophaceae bacterium]|jgi:riboflavin kinase/FMN adenylyltransferase|nr:bifunctional riboflavin kinase/FAD synthetase [Syntrophaceae bacterium]